MCISLSLQADCNVLIPCIQTRYQAIEKLKGALAQHSIAIPVFSIYRVQCVCTVCVQIANYYMYRLRRSQCYNASPVTVDWNPRNTINQSLQLW